MGRQSTIPDLYNECHTIDIGSLCRWGYLKPDQKKTGTITWSRNGNKTGCIDITVMNYSDVPYLELDYNYQQNPIKYRVLLVSVPSNIGKGKVWYFLCPVTKKRCRKLYRIGARFLHREAYQACMYETQTYSKKNRYLVRQYDKYFCREKAYEKIHSKHFRTHYAGKPTKQYQKLTKQIEDSRGVSLEELMCK